MKAPTEMHDLIASPSEDLTRAGEEAELLTQVGRGDVESFAELHQRFSAILFSLAFAILNNRESAEDVIQDVFLQIWEKAPSYDPSRGKASTWALTLARNKAIDRLRGIQRCTRLHETAGRIAGPEVSVDDRHSLREAIVQEQHAGLRRTLEQLTPDQREAIALAYFEDMPYPQVASRLRVPLGTVKARIRRGLQRLRTLLGRQA